MIRRPQQAWSVAVTAVPLIVVALGDLMHRTMTEVEEFAELCRASLAGEPEPAPSP